MTKIFAVVNGRVLKSWREDPFATTARAYNLLNELKKHGAEVVLLEYNQRPRTGIINIIINNMSHIYIAIQSIIIIEKDRPLVYFEYPLFMTAFQNRWIFRICTLLGIRTILDVHDTIDQADAISDGKWALSQQIEEYLFTNASLISFSLSSSMWAEVKKRYNIADDKMIVFVPNGFDESLLELFQDPYKSVKGRFNIMYVGGLSKNRGIDPLVRASLKLHDKYNYIKLYLLGHYGFGVSDELKNIIQTSDFIEKKYVLRRDLPRELKNADLLVMPYNPHEMYMSRITPMKFFEYIGTGIPILSTKCDALGDIMNQGGIIGVDYDFEDFEKKIEQLINDPKLRDRMSLDLMRIRHLHTWEERARRLMDAIESLTRTETANSK